jgi:formate dehydrogenase (coenzyme F420) alpha subunit
MAKVASRYEVKKTICGMCSKSCGIDVYLSEGKIADIKGMKEHPMSKGVICGKAKFAPELQYSPERLTSPLLKKEGTWEAISWDDALDIICRKLDDLKKTDGPEALALYLGNSVGLRDAKRLATRFCDVYGTPNYSSVDALCHWSRTMATDMTVGGYPVPDELNSRCILVVGTNPLDSNVPEYHDLLTALKQGAKLIVVDPRETTLTKKAHLHVSIRPQTDSAFFLGMIHVIISENLYDKEFVERWTIGFDRLAEHVRAYDPERVSRITDVPASTVYEAARMYALNRPASVSQHIAIDHGFNGFQTIRAITILESIMGNIDIKGGGKLTPPAKVNTTKLVKEIHPRTIGLDKCPAFVRYMNQAQAMEFVDTILSGNPYPIKMMILNGSNPLLTWPDATRTEKALRALDLLVVMDPFMTPTARLADLVLPASTFLERTELCDYGYFQGVPTIALRSKIFEPLPESWPDWKFWLELARRMGYEEQFPWKDNEEMLDFVLQPTGITVSQLKQHPDGLPYMKERYQNYLEGGFNTPSGKIELYSERLETLGYEPLPNHREPLESPVSDPELAKTFPLRLLTGIRVTSYWQSSFRNLPGPAKQYPEPLVEINETTAIGKGIKDGDIVKVETRRGSITIRAKVTSSIRPEVVSIPLGWEKSNVNRLTSYEGRDPITGNPAFKSMLCRVGRAVD